MVSMDKKIEVIEPDIRTIWVNVYEEHTEFYISEEAAKDYATDGAIAVAVPVTFEVKK